MSTTSSSTWSDNSHRYGTVSRLFHWTMAALFAWQFTSALLHAFAGDTPIERFLCSTHGTNGFCLMVLVLLRGAWGLSNLKRRPAHQPGPLGRFAAAGHLLLYALMIVVPFLALLRAYGRGRGFAPFGIQVFEATGQQNPALIAPASAVHGLLGWTLLALIVGHIAMVIMHRVVWKDDILTRMAGRA